MFALLLSLLIVAGLPAVGRGQEVAPTGDPVLEALATCVRDRGHLLVMLLMDESGSLRWTDPNNERVPAAKAALSNLRTLAAVEFEGASPTVDVAVSAFASNYTLVTDWTGLDERTAADLHADLDAFSQRNVGFDTDYAIAIGGAREDLARRSTDVTAEGAQVPCKALMVFTDGDYDIELRTGDQTRRHGLYRPYAPDLPLDQPGNPERVIELGKALICDPGGYRDQLVADDIVLVTISFSEELSDAGTDWLGAVTRGQTARQACGARATAENGTLVHANDLIELLAAFNRVTNEIAGGALAPGDEQVPVCPLASCPEGTREFEIDETLSRFHLLADLGSPGIRVELRSPGARNAWVLPEEGAGAESLGSAQLRYEWLSQRALTIDALLPRDTRDWKGTWSITFIDPIGESPDAVANSQIYLYGDVAPQLATVPHLRLGETTELAVEVVDSAGRLLAPATVQGLVNVDATITDPTTDAEEALVLTGPDGEGRFFGTYTVRDDLPASFLILNLRAIVTTAAGVRLAPFARTYQLPISPPLVFPYIEPAELRLSSITGLGTATGTLQIVGGEGRGCVWVDEIRFLQTPDGAGLLNTTITPAAGDEESCIAVAQGERQEIEFEFTNEQVASGRAAGLVGVALTVEGEDRVIRQEVPWRFDMARPVDPVRRILLLVLFLILLLTPIALQYLLNWFGARFEPSHELLFSRTPIAIRASDRIEQTDNAVEGSGYRPELADFTNVGGPSGHARELTIGDVDFRGRLSGSPLNPPYGEATVEGAHVRGPEGHKKRDAYLRGRVPLGLAGSWVFTLDEGSTFKAPAAYEHDDEPADIHGTLVAILSYGERGAFTQQAERLLSRLESDLPQAARALAREVDKQRPARSDGDGQDREHGPDYVEDTASAGSPFPASPGPFPPAHGPSSSAPLPNASAGRELPDDRPPVTPPRPPDY